jgi:hypothetical protein
MEDNVVDLEAVRAERATDNLFIASSMRDLLPELTQQMPTSSQPAVANLQHLCALAAFSQSRCGEAALHFVYTLGKVDNLLTSIRAEMPAMIQEKPIKSSTGGDPTVTDLLPAPTLENWIRQVVEIARSMEKSLHQLNSDINILTGTMQDLVQVIDPIPTTDPSA